MNRTTLWVLPVYLTILLLAACAHPFSLKDAPPTPVRNVGIVYNDAPQFQSQRGSSHSPELTRIAVACVRNYASELDSAIRQNGVASRLSSQTPNDADGLTAFASEYRISVYASIVWADTPKNEPNTFLSSNVRVQTVLTHLPSKKTLWSTEVIADGFSCGDAKTRAKGIHGAPRKLAESVAAAMVRDGVLTPTAKPL